ncbi:MAG: dienelactone hydrolase family protein [Planctomycetota bacterium]|nr:dienelactone hydrolase family protein [Planctomycetota bacterium]MDA1213995.1 dienelactone hydrolase family protein [Planctomycetota bacterium]
MSDNFFLRTVVICCFIFTVVLSAIGAADEPNVMPDTRPLEETGDLSTLMRAGFEKYLLRELDESVVRRAKYWKRSFRNYEAHDASIRPNQARLRKIIGAVDPIDDTVEFEFVGSLQQPALVAETNRYRVYSVRWRVFESVYGEGLLVKPSESPAARFVVVPDADQTPEMLMGMSPGLAEESQFGRRLAEQGFMVLIPVLVNREDTLSGEADVAMTNQTHREWITRQAFELGRHIIGYEVRKIEAAVTAFKNDVAPAQPLIGIAGYGEGGLLSLYAATLDTRIDSVLVSGYFQNRQRIWDEPYYRNLFGILREFGDAELATMIADRALIVEHSAVPTIDGPPQTEGRRLVAAPGRIQTPTYESVQSEVERGNELCETDGLERPSTVLIAGPEKTTIGPGSEIALLNVINGLGLDLQRLTPPGEIPVDQRVDFDPAARQHRQVRELVDHNQRLLRRSHHVRKDYWQSAVPQSAETWQLVSERYRNELWDNMIGRLPRPTIPPNPRSRKVYENEKWVGYEVQLDVYPEVFAWGVLLIPRDLQPGEKRPVVVCQHGLEGTPHDVITDDPASPATKIYQAFAACLAERGFITFAPHNFYRGGNEFRQLQRKAHPLKQTMFALTTIQHQQILDWLSGLEFVDPNRIGFYGLSYGGNTAMRVPALLKQYACVICSGDFNEWAFKNTTVDYSHSMIYHNVYEVFEFDLAHTFNHSDMAALIAPRPFMVERGHDDGVGLDEWVASEYAAVRRLYAQLGIPERTTIEFFNGPHQIHGVGTYEFLHEHLDWPRP